MLELADTAVPAPLDAAEVVDRFPHQVTVDVSVMGTVARVVLVGADAPPLEDVVAELERLERMWSRFRDDSELGRLNAGDGHPTLVSHPTTMLLERAVWAWRRSGGRFDPTVLDAVRAAGYDRTFRELADRSIDVVAPPSAVSPPVGTPAPGCGDIEVDTRLDLVRLPIGVRIDPGAIGKGLAADLVATAAVEQGADAALVSLGGDLRVAGEPPSEGWEIELDHHLTEPARVNLLDGAIATSSTLRRRWRTADGPAHHVIDPRTGRPSTGPVVACSVLAAEAWWAEAVATSLLVGWGEPDVEEELVGLLDDAGALLTFADGHQQVVGPLADSFSPGKAL
ncbi:MAG: FAD:protein FMN transferase [Microthrixaceae bacterium]